MRLSSQFCFAVQGTKLCQSVAGMGSSATFRACERAALAYRDRVLGQLSIPAFGVCRECRPNVSSERGWGAAVNPETDSF